MAENNNSLLDEDELGHKFWIVKRALRRHKQSQKRVGV